MENGSSWGVWVAYVVIVAFLLFVLVVFARTMMLFSTLTFMPVARALRQIGRLLGRRNP
jgi:hypothetical protein